MEMVINVEDLQNLDLLGSEYTELDLYDTFMMFLLLSGQADNDHIVLRGGSYTLDSNNCFGVNNWMS